MPRLWMGIYTFTAVIIAIAVGVFVWQARESRQAASAPPVRSGPIPAERLELLAKFEAPPYVPSPGKRAPGRFAAGMQHYLQRDYAGAIPALRSAVDDGFQAIESRYYLGICYLLINQRDLGLAELRAVIGAGNTPHLEAARFYAAKGLLGGGDVEGARTELENVVGMHADMERQARVLLSQIGPATR